MIAAMAGDNLHLEAHAPMLVVTDRQPHFLNAVIGVMGATLSFKQLDNGTMVIGFSAHRYLFAEIKRADYEQ